MTATDNVKSDKNTTGAKKVSGLFCKGLVTMVMIETPRMI